MLQLPVPTELKMCSFSPLLYLKVSKVSVPDLASVVEIAAFRSPDKEISADRQGSENASTRMIVKTATNEQKLKQ
jgi:hypothetical protein